MIHFSHILILNVGYCFCLYQFLGIAYLFACYNYLFLLFPGANCIIVISTAIIASVLIDNGIDELSITGHITPGLPPFKIPDFSIDRPGTNGTEGIHKSFGNILGVSIADLFVYQCCLLITLTNTLDPDQARRIVGHDQDQNCLTF